MPATTSSVSPAKNPVADALQQFLSDTYALYLLTHNYHWNVEGPRFSSLHLLFEQQYNELFLAVDLIAERIRALDSYALPDHYSAILKAVDAVKNPLLKEADSDKIADKMVRNLMESNQKAIESAKIVKEKAAKQEDDESEDLAVQRIQVHQKAVWMLRSILK